ncbi:MAG: DUF4252 domain-containing protein [Bacteroidales bacterium]|nr:DUF4252 domain-containing protein [Bacteroidales bacterium]
MKKKIILILVCLMSFAGIAFSATPLTRARLTSLIRECKNYEGTEVVRLGSFTTGALKGLVWIASSGDPDAKEFLKLCRGIKSMSIMEFEDCHPADRAYINERIQGLLDDSDVLMDIKEDGQHLSIYGVFDENKNTIGDFVLYSAEDCALICLFGKISMDVVSELAK